MAKTKLTRRDVFKASVAAAGSALVAPYVFTATARAGGLDPDAEALVQAVQPRTPLNQLGFKPFSLPILVPPVLKAGPSFRADPGFPINPQWGRLKFYQVTAKHGTAQIIRGVFTDIFGYNGQYPGPTITQKLGETPVIRFTNRLDNALISTHLHGGFTPACSDGYPSNFILPVGLTREELVSSSFIEDVLLRNECPVRPFLPAEFAAEIEELNRLFDGECPLGTHEGFKDYVFPGIVPDGNGSNVPSTMWYHDHALDMTAVNTYHGLAGFYIFTDPLEQNLIKSGKLPASQFDFGLVLQDRILDADGQLFFDCLNHDGFLGDLFLVNGRLQPVMHVQRRKYRFRLLNGAPARHWEIVFTPEDRMMPVLQIGNDSWMLPKALRRDSLLLAPAERHDVIVDFTNAPNEVFMRNILLQNDGRAPEGTRDNRVTVRPGYPMLKFIVGPATSKPPDATIQAGDALRPHDPITPSQIVRTRTLEFERQGGQWVINGRAFDPFRNDTPGATLGKAERWFLKNVGGGWWHPMHIHQVHHEIISVDGKAPPEHERAKKDVSIMAGNTVVEIFLKFAALNASQGLEYEGPYSSHCHIIQHEDARMMINLNPTRDGGDGRLAGLA